MKLFKFFSFLQKKPLEASGPWPDPPIPDFDEENFMVPPWIKYPNLLRGSMGWRMGIGEDYRERFDTWLIALPRNLELR
ncbi:MAG: hypothetical protein KDD62_13850, partial [Bdellovibrionales bacterium]|nr:hypothetical protein [Bdellovibrionales bacterium]